MPNDVADWTIVNQVVPIGGVSKAILGDVATPTIAIDVGVESESGLFGSISATGSLASFKPAAGSIIAKVGVLGAVVNSSADVASPAFGQATTAGNLLVAWLSTTGAEPTTAAAGWVKATDQHNGGDWTAIWVRPNCGGAEAAPTFTSTGSGGLLTAQLGEFSGVATVSPTENTGGATSTSASITVSAGATDAAFGDLVLMVVRWVQSGAATPTFSDSFSNGGTAVQAGLATFAGFHVAYAVNDTYAIIPAAATPQPLGVASWRYDSVKQNLPAVGNVASVVFPATPGKAYTLAAISAALVVTTAAADRQFAEVKDGANVVWARYLSCDGVIDRISTLDLSGLAIPGTLGNSMTVDFGGVGANSLESVAAGVYLR